MVLKQCGGREGHKAVSCCSLAASDIYYQSSHLMFSQFFSKLKLIYYIENNSCDINVIKSPPPLFLFCSLGLSDDTLMHLWKAAVSRASATTAASPHARHSAAGPTVCFTGRPGRRHVPAQQDAHVGLLFAPLLCSPGLLRGPGAHAVDRLSSR